MATPQNVVYSGASGAVIRAGSAVLAPVINAHGLNRIVDVLTAQNIYTINGVSGQSGGVRNPGGFFDYTGSTFAPTLGPKGATIFHGGGHNGYFGNDTVILDHSTLLFSRLSAALTTLYSGSGGSYGTNYSLNGEAFADASGTTTLANQPGASHMYDHSVHLPAGIGGSGAKGMLVTTSRYGTSPNAGYSQWSQGQDLASATWSRFSTNIIQIDQGDPQYTSALYDATRLHVARLDNAWNTQILDVNATKTWANGPRLSTTSSPKPPGINGYSGPTYGTFRHLVSLDLYAFFYFDGSGFAVTDPNNLAAGWFMPPITGSMPNQNGGWGWDDTNKRMGFYAGDGSKTLFFLTPPSSNPKTNAWVVSSKTGTGTTPTVNDSGHPHQSRLNWVPALSAWVWVGSVYDPGVRFENF